jgi:hypothetical protein
VVPAANYSILPKWQFLHVSASWTSWSSVKMIPRVCESDLLRSATLSMRRILAVFGWVKCLGTCKGVRRYLMGYLLSCSMHMLCVKGFRARFWGLEITQSGTQTLRTSVRGKTFCGQFTVHWQKNSKWMLWRLDVFLRGSSHRGWGMLGRSWSQPDSTKLELVFALQDTSSTEAAAWLQSKTRAWPALIKSSSI